MVVTRSQKHATMQPDEKTCVDTQAQCLHSVQFPQHKCDICTQAQCATCYVRSTRFTASKDANGATCVYLKHVCPGCRYPSEVFSMDDVVSCGSAARMNARKMHRALMWSDFKGQFYSGPKYYAPNMTFLHRSSFDTSDPGLQCSISAHPSYLEVALHGIDDRFCNTLLTFRTALSRICTDEQPCRNCRSISDAEKKGDEHDLGFEMWHGTEPNFRGCLNHTTNAYAMDGCTTSITYYFNCLHQMCDLWGDNCIMCDAERVVPK